ncbi:MAG: elongation factor P maturation arginine rhamnosyltransferase EarP [Betaproteobacteria bacterium]|nr:elongation factor P maturation arginine rhamnosyltransferase EarP [Betaproteobacteria bacterium]
MTAAVSWDIFCNVVDHFGDVGVSWRLARQLHAEHGARVRLFVDDLETFHVLCADVSPALESQEVAGVTIRKWTSPLSFGDPADVAIDAFGSRAPEAYLEAMARRRHAPVWINLEYLSAEDWIEDCHRVPSRHPRFPLVRHFFFPGFTENTGGVLCERDLVTQRRDFLGDASARARLWQAWGMVPPPDGTSVISLFGYGGPAVPALLRAWAEGSEPVCVLVPESRILPDALSVFGRTEAHAGERFGLDALDLRVLPFQTQPGYDRLLWASDCNFVRGEDSFVRAQWAESPFVWNIYAQEGGAHWAKMHAFVTRYGAGLDDDAIAAVREFWRLWNRGETSASVIGAAWRRFWNLRDDLRAHNAAWTAGLRALGDLAGNLVRFSVERL